MAPHDRAHLAVLMEPDRASQHSVSVREDEGSDVHSFNKFLKIVPDGNSVLGGDLKGHTTLHESPHLCLEPLVLLEELYCVAVMLQEHLRLLVKLSGAFQPELLQFGGVLELQLPFQGGNLAFDATKQTASNGADHGRHVSSTGGEVP